MLIYWQKTNTIQGKTETVIDASKEAGITEVNAEKTNYMLKSRYQNKGQTHNIMTAYRLLEHFQIFGNSSNKSTLQSSRGSKQVNFGQSLLPFYIESSVFPLLCFCWIVYDAFNIKAK
jgi:hypothetical protein